MSLTAVSSQDAELGGASAVDVCTDGVAEVAALPVGAVATVVGVVVFVVGVLVGDHLEVRESALLREVFATEGVAVGETPSGGGASAAEMFAREASAALDSLRPLSQPHEERPTIKAQNAIAHGARTGLINLRVSDRFGL